MKQQKILLLANSNGGKINYKQQSIFKTEHGFNTAMKHLVNARILKNGKDENYYDVYELTGNARILLNQVIPLNRD